MNEQSFKIVLGRKIKQLRLLLHITQEELARKLGYEGSGTISQIERG